MHDRIQFLEFLNKRNFCCRRLEIVYFTCVVGPPQFNNFEDLQGNETMQLLQTYPATSDKHSILLGDFNQGPAVFSVLANRNLSGQYESNYWKVINSGYISPYVDDVTLCLSCGENGLRNLTGSSDSKILDHIYVQNGSRTRVTNVQVSWKEYCFSNTRTHTHTHTHTHTLHSYHLIFVCIYVYILLRFCYKALYLFILNL